MNKDYPATALPADYSHKIQQAGLIWLFLDYDGTLAEFAPTPDHILPDGQLIDLLGKLARHPRIRLSVVSGRRLSHVEKLIPLQDILLAGTYGVEMRLPDGNRHERVPYDEIRPTLERIKPHWQDLIEDRPGYFLEDKGWAVALHGRHARDGQADQILVRAQQIAIDMIPDDSFRLLDGYKFLEVGPKLADKGTTMRYLLDRYDRPDALLIYLGDDDKDESAFAVINEFGGLAIVVSAEERKSYADFRLNSPQETRAWLIKLLEWLETEN